MKLTITKTPFLYITWAFVILSMFLSGFIEISKTDYSITIWFKSQVVQHDALLAPVSKFIWVENMSKSELNKSFEKYLDEKKDNSDKWMTWMSILSTIFAVFFVYSSFRIDWDMRKVTELANQKLDEINRIALNRTEDIMIDAYLWKIFSLQANHKFEAVVDFINKKLESPEIIWKAFLEYALLKEKGNTYWLWWEYLEWIEHNEDNQDKYLNAITFHEEAMKKEQKPEDDEVLSQYKDKYDSFTS